MSRFYTFRQNNSGGSFVGVQFLIVEANSSIEANELAQTYCDVYFDGVNEGIDCDCCGDRWYPVDESDGSDIPLIYGRNPILDDREFDIRYANGSWYMRAGRPCRRAVRQ